VSGAYLGTIEAPKAAHVRFAPKSGQTADHLGKSALCQRPGAPQQKAPLFDYLVGDNEQRGVLDGA
jgi:hypothetical protein